MTQLVLNIKDNHINFFLDLIRGFDFVKIENEKEFTELTDHQKSILEERLENYQNNPESYLDWDDVKKEIDKTIKPYLINNPILKEISNSTSLSQY